MNFPVKYENGNYYVMIKEDGTKIRYTNADEFIPTRPETLDINISNYCENNCPYCYIDASPEGKHGDLNHSFFDTILPYTEIAINYAKHPDLEIFLYRMRGRDIIVNMTINQIDFLNNTLKLYEWQKLGLIHGLGISVSTYDLEPLLIDFKNVVAHTIWGITSYKQYERISIGFDKVLVLGYKTKGRGKNLNPVVDEYIEIEKLYELFDIVSFDNLAIDQIGMKYKVSEEEWENCYMGEEGSASFFIDTVDQKFYKSSIEEGGISISDFSVKEMFNIVRTM